MTGPNAEGGPLPPVDPERLAEHEQRLADWRREIEEERSPAEMTGAELAEEIRQATARWDER